MPTWCQTVVLSALMLVAFVVSAAEPARPSEATADRGEKKVAVGQPAPEFTIKDAQGKDIRLSDLTAQGPVLVRLTCGCSGCDKELAYFQALHNAYKDKGLTSVAVFREPDAKVAKYVEEKKLNMLYAVDTKGESWSVWETKTMPTNFLIDKGGKIVSIAAGCDPSGLLAARLSDKVAGLVQAEKVDVQKTAEGSKPAENKPAR